MDLLLRLLECPWVMNSIPSRSRRERRMTRVRAPSPVAQCVVYRSDGASRKAARVRMAGFGGARWSEVSSGYGVPEATIKGFLGDETNNVAEYVGLEAMMRNAVVRARPGTLYMFEVDSKLLARQVQAFGLGKFACRSFSLWPWWERCVRHGNRLEQAQCNWRIRHIYREFNQTADQLANEGIDEGIAETKSPTWD